MTVSPATIEAAASRIGALVRRTPTMELDGAIVGHSGPVVLKLELVQHSGSFKARGATSALTAARERGDDLSAGVVAASGGNHGVAVAWAAATLGLSATIFVPVIASPAKVARLRSYGAEVVQVGDVYQDALDASAEFIVRTGARAVHAYDDPDVVSGAGTLGRELEDQAGAFDRVLVACGGGGLAGGVAAWLGDRAQVIVCETPGTATFAAARAAGGPVDVEVSGIAADALGATRLGATGWEALDRTGATGVVVDDDALVETRRWLWEELRLVVEVSAAAPLAALRHGAVVTQPGMRLCVVLCGANTSPDDLGAATP